MAIDTYFIKTCSKFIFLHVIPGRSEKLRDNLKNVGNGHQSENCEDPCVLKNEYFLFQNAPK
jgi:hypothetical protein